MVGRGRERQPEDASTARGLLAAFLRVALGDRGFSTGKFLERLNNRTKISRSTVDRWLSGKSGITWDNLEAISAVLGYPDIRHMMADFAAFRRPKSRRR